MNSICQKSRDNKSAKTSRRELIDRIAMGVAHEIRNPLTVIKGYLQLQERKSAYCTGESLGIIYQELHRIEALATNIIALAQNKAIKKSPVNLNGLLKKIYPVIQSAALKNGIVTELLLGDNLPMLDLNAEEIEQLVVNLACNGIEAMQANGRLTIGAVRKSSRVILYIQDEGSGIPPEQLEQIFDPFYTTKECNTGLGLAVSRSIVERHHGKIKIVSTLGAGSVFKILFPILERGQHSGRR
ncbi:two-component system sensor histidine kinase NtrB [Sporomusa malonica]|uniref:histidine kinase n=1 Tax=Sporomusa malonica TaxID=112901 RepID=A0A1W1ZR59_9FIRM|nr:ATP-binding protein [Sporomusa malonica]SMC51025.1 His Kinase A (phospho-acceptor) domain-containing protein [Sporomusa malonica]